MSDLETPEADMMRDHSSLEAAPATLRLEELRPGLDPNNPGAAPDTTLDHVALEGVAAALHGFLEEAIKSTTMPNEPSTPKVCDRPICIPAFARCGGDFERVEDGSRLEFSVLPRAHRGSDGGPDR
jgi:hypothetical protein